MRSGAAPSPGRPGASRALVSVALVAVVMASCAGPTVEDDEGGPRVLRISTAWQRSVSGAEFRDRVRALSRALERLRDETGSGWTGLQDDVTGFLSELSGGRYTGRGEPEDAMTALLDAYGPELFGVGPEDLEVVSSEPVTDDVVALRAEQHVADIPVLDGTVVVTVSGVGKEDPRVNTVRGRLFAGVDAVPTEPQVEGSEALRIAAEQSGGETQGQPTLVVVPLGEGGALAWEVSVAAIGASGELEVGRYYVDAVRGAVVLIRPGTAELGVPFRSFGSTLASSPGALSLLRRLQQAATACGATGETVEVTGAGPLGEELRGQGLQTADGIVLVDTSTSSFDPATGDGAVCTYDATGVLELPGSLVASDSPALGDAEALAAHVLSRYVQDYFRAVHGRDSWDGQGGNLISSVHYGDPDFCNAFFSDSLDPPQMVYGAPCTIDGVPQSGSLTEVDVTGHEITHGVTDTTAGLLYVGQSGALNESFSDYFGNVIGDRLRGTDTNAVAEGICQGLTPPTDFCTANPDGSASLRYMDNRNTFEDYANLLSTPYRLWLVGFKQDRGGVHLNSSIWNNALWGIRIQLARLDGQPMTTSPRAAAFDRAVYAALARHLGPGSGFLDARGAVEQAAVEVGMDAESVRVMRRGFDTNLICSGCVPSATNGLGISTTSASQQLPVVSGEQIAWLDISLGEGVAGQAAFASATGRQARSVSGRPDALSVAFAGQALVTAEDPPRIVRYDVEAGTSEVLDPQPEEGVIVGVAGSDRGAAWVSFGSGELKFVDADGVVTSAPLPSGFGSPFSIGTDGTTVVAGAEDGTVLSWRPGSDPEVIGNGPGAAFGVDVAGDAAVVLAGQPGELDALVIVLPLDGGEPTVLSDTASPFGLAMNQRYVVWAENVGDLPGGIVQDFGLPFSDTDLWLHSLGTGITYEVLDARGQQGFPDIFGDRLVWQDALLGGDDIFTGTLPGGL